MSIYFIAPISGGRGFKVHVADMAGGLRVVGIFFDETAAEAWIEADRDACGAVETVGAEVLASPA